jgi:Fic family protein
MEEIIRALELKKQLDSLRPLEREQEARIMQKFRLDWNYHSNNLEGNSLTYGETKALIMHGITAQGKPLKDHFEITGHNEAINWILDIVKGSDYPLTENFIRELHTLLLKEPYEVDAQTPDGKPTKKRVKVGSYKTSPNHVQTKTGEMFYFATPEETPSKMGDLIVWYNEKIADTEFNPILLAAEFHYKFILIHPFDDGNGRTARILMNFILMKFGYPPVIIKTEDKENYYAVLRLADTGNLEAFVEYIAKNLNRSLEIMIAGANGEDIEEPDDIDKEIALLERRLNSIAEKTDITRNEANIDELVDDVLEKIGDAIITKSEKIKGFYTDIICRYKVKSKPNEWYSKDDVKLVKLQYNDAIILNIDYNRFKARGFGRFNYEINIHCKLNDTNYAVFNPQHFFTITKPYGIKLSESEIDKIASVEVKRHTAFIEQKIAEKEKGQ